MEIPDNWPKWKLRCGAKLRKREGTCNSWACIGMPTCKFHGSGGKKNKHLGEVRYMCWVILGGPQNMPVELACRVALHVFSEAVLNRGEGTLNQQMKAAMWLTNVLE